MAKETKKIGIGSLSIVIFFVGVIFSLNLNNSSTINDNIFNSVGLMSWSRDTTGFHYSLVISILIFIIAQILGKKFNKDLGATLGKNLSIYFGVFILILMVFMGLIAK
jgi:phosphoglycerol transferase MdoB-like AlkP superfamily enzyme